MNLVDGFFFFSSFFFSFSSHSQCDLTEIPSAIGRLVDLQEVTLAENPVTSFPGEERDTSMQ